MSDSTGLRFRAFRFAQRALRGTGLGRIRYLRRIRDTIYQRVRPRENLIITVHGLKMAVDPNQTGLVPYLLIDGTWERCETDFLRSVLTPGAVFVDVGSNIGYYALIAANIVGKEGRVFAFEPEPANFACLQKNVELNGFTNVVLRQKAVCEKAGLAQLFLDPEHTDCHSLAGEGRGGRSIQIEAVTLDQCLEDTPGRVDVLKMDIEGYEPFAFQGMKKTLERNPRVTLISEFAPAMITRAGASPEKFIDEILAMGFTLRLINEFTGKVEPASRDHVLSYCQKYGSTNLACSRT